jgi:hypothetical protein
MEGRKLRQIIKRSRLQMVRIPNSFPVKNSNLYHQKFPPVTGRVDVGFIGSKMEKAILSVRFSAW